MQSVRCLIYGRVAHVSLARRLLFGIHQSVKPLWCLSGVGTTPFHTTNTSRFKEDRKTTAVAIIDNLKQVRHSPTPALLLGLSGLVPFLAPPCLMLSSGLFDPQLAQVQLYYGASILSFLGGVRWGLTLPETSSQPPDWHNLGYSVIPSLVAWLALLAPQPLPLLTVMGGLALAGYMDMAMWGYPTWFKGMRFCLTFVAVLSLWTTFILKYIKEDNEAFEPRS